MKMAVLMLVIFSVALLGAAASILMFIFDDRVKSNIAVLTAAAVCFASTVFNLSLLPKSMSIAIAFAYVPAVLAFLAIISVFVLKRFKLAAKIMLCAGVIIGIIVAFGM